MIGAFQTAALELHKRGLFVIPTGGKDGKAPLVRGFARWRGQARETVEDFARKHPGANIGIVTGLSRVTVVDADDEKTLAEAEGRFGPSPIVARSPRGGGHLYYRSSGERCANLRPFGLNVDIKGIGGMVLAPPSVRAGVGSYTLERGGWDDLQDLPTLAPGAIPERTTTPARAKPGAIDSAEGQRNNDLFTALLNHADGCESLNDLTTDAHAINAQFSPPLPRIEAEKVARSVWRMKAAGRIILTTRPGVLVTFRELETLGADGFFLAQWLKRWHGSKQGRTFALSPKAMEKAEVLKGWGRRRYELAILETIRAGIIERTHKGGSKRGDYSTFRLIGKRHGAT